MFPSSICDCDKSNPGHGIRKIQRDCTACRACTDHADADRTPLGLTLLKSSIQNHSQIPSMPGRSTPMWTKEFELLRESSMSIANQAALLKAEGNSIN